MKRSLTIVLCLLMVISGYPVEAGMFGPSDQDYSKFCQIKSPRQTVVLIDDQLMVEGQLQWGESLRSILRGSLMPSEPLTVIQLKTVSGAAEQVWSGCYPDYSGAEKIAKDKKASILDKPWRKILESQQAAFGRDFGSALGKVLTDGKRSAGEVSIDIASPPKKQLLRALKDAAVKFDKGRGHLREIIYSDMLENSDLANSLKPNPDHQAVIKMVRDVGLNFQQAVVYIYGVGSTFSGEGQDSKVFGKFWGEVLDASVSHVAGFGSDLAITAGVPSGTAKYEFTVKVLEESRHGSMLIFHDNDGRMLDSVAVAGATQRSLLTEGTYTCSSDNKCTLEAKLPRGLVTTNDQNDPALMETVKMTGSREKMTGKIGVIDAKLAGGGNAEFEISAKLIQ
jgi:hypothetical protein